MLPLGPCDLGERRWGTNECCGPPASALLEAVTPGSLGQALKREAAVAEHWLSAKWLLLVKRITSECMLGGWAS